MEHYGSSKTCMLYGTLNLKCTSASSPRLFVCNSEQACQEGLKDKFTQIATFCQTHADENVLKVEKTIELNIMLAPYSSIRCTPSLWKQWDPKLYWLPSGSYTQVKWVGN